MLNQDQIDQLRLTFATNGWNSVIKPVIANRAREAIKALILSPSERGAGSLSDADLRAVINDCEWLLTYFDKEIEVSEHNRQLDELQQSQNGA